MANRSAILSLMNARGFGRAVICAALLAAIAGAAGAEPTTTLDVQSGWGGHVRAGTWNPIFLTISDLRPRNIMIDVSASEGGSRAMRIHLFGTIDPVPRTFTVYLPLQANDSTGPQVAISDADSGRLLARHPEDPDSYILNGNYLESNARLAGASGAPGTIHHMDALDGTSTMKGAFLTQDLLPETPIGYDSLRLLILTQPDLLHLTLPQQQAIVDWVRAGGTLFLWPGDDPAPRTSPLIDVLPCRIGGQRTDTLPPDVLARAGLRKRFASIHGRVLERVKSIPNIAPIPLFPGSTDPQNLAYDRKLGLGRVLVSPINLTQLDFDSPELQEKFWRPLLKDAAGPEGNAPVNTYDFVNSDQRRQAYASERLEDYLGNVQGAGRFGFSYVAIVLLGMMALVGPVDWFVLRKLGRQPMTWFTTAFWIALITVGAIYVGKIFKSGNLYYHSARVVDQVDGQTVAEASIVSIYSPRSTEYHLDGAPPAGPGSQQGSAVAPYGWWSTIGNDEYSRRRSMKSEFSFHQMDQGNVPDELSIHVWNLKFVRSDAVATGPARLSATLSIKPSHVGERSRIIGTVRNLTAAPLVNVRIKCAEGVTSPIARIEPNASVAVDSEFDASAAHSDDSPMNNNYYYYPGELPMPASELWRRAGEISGARSRLMDAAVTDGAQACVFAEVAAPIPPAFLREPGAIEDHYELIRALVPLSRK